MDGTENQTEVVEVNYSQQAVDEVNNLVGKIDFGVFMTMFIAIVGATIGVSVGMTALKKGVSWLKSQIKRAGN